MQDIFHTRTCDDWCERLRAAGIACGPVNNVAEFARNPAIKDRYLFEVPSEEVSVPQIRSPLEVDRERRTMADTGIPRLGEHTDEVLATVPSMSPTEIARLRDLGAIR